MILDKIEEPPKERMKDYLLNVEPERLKPDPENKKFFADLAGLEFEGLCSSVASIGVINPITVTPDYVVIAGHQRLRAALKAGLKQVPVIIRAVESKEELETVRIMENVFRRGGKMSESIVAIKRMIAAGWAINRVRGQFNYKTSDNKTLNILQYAEKLGISGPTVLAASDIAEHLIPEFLSLLGESKDDLQPWAAYQLARLKPADQKALYRLLGADVRGMTYAEAKRLRERVQYLEDRIAHSDRRIKQAKDEVDKYKTKAAEAKRDDIIRKLEQRMRDELAEVLMKHDQDYEDRIAELKSQFEKEAREIREKMLEKFKKQARKGIHAEIERLRPFLNHTPEEIAAKTGGLFEEQVVGAIELCERLSPWLTKFSAALRQERGLKQSATRTHLTSVS